VKFRKALINGDKDETSKLNEFAKKADEQPVVKDARQLVYYQQGLGTEYAYDIGGRLFQTVSKKLDQGFAFHLKTHVTGTVRSLYDLDLMAETLSKMAISSL